MIKGWQIFLIILLSSTLINFSMTKIETKKYPAPGKLIEINGHEMHIYGEGEGSPTVLYTAGCGTFSAVLDFSSIQRSLSDTSRVTVYERPGYGWSEKASTPRTTEQIVEDFHLLLEKAGEKPPYILVGHSMGALEILDFAQKYPGEVSGIVLIDGKSPYMSLKYKGARFLETLSKYSFSFLRATGMIRWAGYLGLPPNVFQDIKKLPDDIQPQAKVMYFKNFMNSNVLKETKEQEVSARRLIEVGSLNDIPLTIISSEIQSGRIPEWEDTQKQLLAWSTDSKWIIVEDADHYIHLQRPDIIINEINKMIDLARNK